MAPWPTSATCSTALGGQGDTPVWVRSSEGLGLAADSPQLVKYIWATFLIGLAVGELDWHEAMPLIEPACAGIGLKRVQSDR